MNTEHGRKWSFALRPDQVEKEVLIVALAVNNVALNAQLRFCFLRRFILTGRAAQRQKNNHGGRKEGEGAFHRFPPWKSRSTMKMFRSGCNKIYGKTHVP